MRPRHLLERREALPRVYALYQVDVEFDEVLKCRALGVKDQPDVFKRLPGLRFQVAGAYDLALGVDRVLSADVEGLRGPAARDRLTERGGAEKALRVQILL